MRKHVKLFSNQSIRSLDEKARTAEYIISSDHVDRMGEIVEQTWQLENYKQNPIVLFGHDPSKADNVLGKCVELETINGDDDHKITVAKVQFAEEGTSANADTVWKLIKQGILKTVSVGFIPHTFKHTTDKSTDDEITVLSDNELLEFSIVPIPANPNAVALAFEDGSITEKDAKFMLKSYEAESSYLKSSLCDIMEKTQPAQNKENKGMSDDDIKKLAEALGAVIDEKIGTKLDEIMSKLDDGENNDEGDEKPADDGDANGDNQLSTDDDEEKPEDKPEDGEDDDEDEDKKDLDEEAEKALLEEIDKMSDDEVEALAKELNL